MTTALFGDYVRDLKVLVDEIDATPENFRSFDLHIDLAHKGLLFVYETRRKLGQTDSIYYARMAKTGANKQVSQKTAYDAVSAFLGLGQFVALTGEPAKAADDAAPTVNDDSPSCAVSFTYRKTGMEKAASMKMVFLGIGDTDDAVRSIGDRVPLVETRPFRSKRLWEWA